MPFINVRTAQGLLDEDQKLRLHRELTDVLVRVEGGGDPDFRRYVTVLLEEHPATAWSIAGQAFTKTAVTGLAESAAQAARRTNPKEAPGVPETQEQDS